MQVILMIRALPVFLCVLVGSMAQATAVEKTPLQRDAQSFGLALPAPDGYCELSTAHPADRDMLAAAEQLNAGYNRVLSFFAECGQLEAMRAKGTALSNYAAYLMPMAAGDAPLSMSRSRFIDDLTKALDGTDMTGKVRDTVQDRLDEADLAIELQELVGLGALHWDDTGLFTGFLMRAAANDAEAEVSAVVAATTLVNGRILTLNLAAPYKNQQTIDSLLAQQRGNIRQLIDAN